MITLSVQVLTASVLLAVALRETFLLVRNRGDLALRVLAPGLLCLAFAATVGIPAPALQQPLVDLVGRSVYSSTINAGFMTMAYSFATFFVLADKRVPENIRKRAALRDLILLLLAVLVIYVVRLTAPDDVFTHPREVADYKRWQHVVYDMTCDWCAIIFWYLGLRRAVRYMRTLDHRWLRWSLGLVTAGVVTLAVGVNVTSIVIDTLHILIPEGPQHPRRFSALRPIYLVGLHAGQTTLAVGLVLPTIAAAVLSARRLYDQFIQSRYLRKMTPLWQALTAEFPYIVLPTSSGMAGVSTARRGSDPGFTRCVTEITDGLARLSPYYVAAGLDPTRPPGGVSDPGTAARIVHGALRARADERRRAWDGEDIRSGPPFPRLEPDFQGWRDMARWMAQLTRRLDQLADVRGPANDGELAR